MGVSIEDVEIFTFLNITLYNNELFTLWNTRLYMLGTKKKEKKEELFKKRNQKTKVTLNLYCVH